MDASMKVIDYVKRSGGNMSLHLTERSRHHRCWSVFFLFDGAMQWSKNREAFRRRKAEIVSDACADECAECADPG